MAWYVILVSCDTDLVVNLSLLLCEVAELVHLPPELSNGGCAPHTLAAGLCRRHLRGNGQSRAKPRARARQALDTGLKMKNFSNIHLLYPFNLPVGFYHFANPTYRIGPIYIKFLTNLNVVKMETNALLIANLRRHQAVNSWKQLKHRIVFVSVFCDNHRGIKSPFHQNNNKHRSVSRQIIRGFCDKKMLGRDGQWWRKCILRETKQRIRMLFWHTIHIPSVSWSRHSIITE